MRCFARHHLRGNSELLTELANRSSQACKLNGNMRHCKEAPAAIYYNVERHHSRSLVKPKHDEMGGRAPHNNPLVPFEYPDPAKVVRKVCEFHTAPRHLPCFPPIVDVFGFRILNLDIAPRHSGGHCQPSRDNIS